MNPLFRCGLIVLMLFFSWTTSAHALLFERRKTFDSEISWFVYPVIGSNPGVQDFYGLGGTVSGIRGSESDITAISLRGKAKYFDDDFQIDILSISIFHFLQNILPSPGFQQISVTLPGRRVSVE